MCFAYTQRSLCLLESVCRCVQMNEPVLLVGETGVGKTAVINFLSQLTGNSVFCFNLCYVHSYYGLSSICRKQVGCLQC